MKTPKRLVHDMISRDKWVECPRCHGLNSERCPICGGEGIVTVRRGRLEEIQ